MDRAPRHRYNAEFLAEKMSIDGARSLRVSAPGKVLLTGGYLILDDEFSGLVLATSARFYTTITRRHAPEQVDDAGTTALLRIRVKSPQFHQTILASAAQTDGGRLSLHVSTGSARNAYIEETLLCALNGVLGLRNEVFTRTCDEMRANKEELHIQLEADNAFYSQVSRLQEIGKPLCRSSLQELPAFLPPIVDADSQSGRTSIAKTGLGSSAALVTSLVGAIVHFFVGAVGSSMRNESQLPDLIHNLAQVSHCFVQRKIGSGFDVSTATYGSQRYSRFPPSMLDAFTSPENLTPASVAECIRDQTKWRVAERMTTFNVPANFHLLMGDVSTGSATVSMVKQFLHWQKADPVESARVVSSLSTRNDAVERIFLEIGRLEAKDKVAFAHKCAEMALVRPDQWHEVDLQIGSMLYVLRDQYQTVRRTFRKMGELAGVPIEPKEQEALIDATVNVPGVLIAGVPGAGGYDALFVITLDAATLDRVEQLWLSWPTSHPKSVICPLLCDIATSMTPALLVEALNHS